MVSGVARRLVRKRVESQMNSAITVRRGPLGTLNTTTGLVGGLSTTTLVYSGKARVRLVAPGGSTPGPDPIVLRQTIISIPINSPVPHKDDLVLVSATNLDTDGTEADVNLDARAFRVQEVDGGGYFGDARRMTCTSWFPSRTWSGTK